MEEERVIQRRLVRVVGEVAVVEEERVIQRRLVRVVGEVAVVEEERVIQRRLVRVCCIFHRKEVSRMSFLLHFSARMAI